MSESKLSSLIEELESELQHVTSVDEQLIQSLHEDLDKLKQARLNEEEAESSPFLEAAVHFEEQHPKTATILNDIAYLLTNIGV